MAHNRKKKPREEKMVVMLTAVLSFYSTRILPPLINKII